MRDEMWKLDHELFDDENKVIGRVVESGIQ